MSESCVCLVASSYCTQKVFEKKLFGVFHFSKTSVFPTPFFWKTSVLYIKSSFIWKSFLCLSFQVSSVGLDFRALEKDVQGHGTFSIDDCWPNHHQLWFDNLLIINNPLITNSFLLNLRSNCKWRHQITTNNTQWKLFWCALK